MPKSANNDEVFRFATDSEGTVNLSGDDRLALLAVSIAHQQAAGFKRYLDLRQFECPECKAPGFNSGFGFIRFTCRGELLSDGEWSEPCTASEATP